MDDTLVADTIGEALQGPRPRIQARDLAISGQAGAGPLVVNLTVNPGDLLAIIGGRGGERTSLLRMLAGLEAPRVGSCLVEGRPDGSHGAEERAAASLFTSSDLSAGEGAADFLALLRHAAGAVDEGPEKSEEPEEPDAVRSDMRLRTLAQVLGLVAGGTGEAGELVGGASTQIALARLLWSSPDLIALDEPFVGQEPRHLSELAAMLGRARRMLGTTVLYAASTVDEITATATGVLEIPAAAPGAASQSSSGSTEALRLLLDVLSAKHRQAQQEAQQEVQVDPASAVLGTRASEPSGSEEAEPGLSADVSPVAAAPPVAAHSTPAVVSGAAPAATSPSAVAPPAVQPHTASPAGGWLAIEACLASAGPTDYFWPDWVGRARDLALLLDDRGLCGRSNVPTARTAGTAYGPLAPLMGRLTQGPGFDPRYGGPVMVDLEPPGARAVRIRSVLVDLRGTPPRLRPLLVRPSGTPPRLVLAIWRGSDDTLALRRLVRLLEPGQKCLPVLGARAGPSSVPPFAYLRGRKADAANTVGPVAVAHALRRGDLVAALPLIDGNLRQGPMLPAIEALGPPQLALEVLSARRLIAADLRPRLRGDDPAALAAARALQAGGLRQAALLLAGGRTPL